MTKGQFVLVTNDKVYYSPIFEGDMGLGQDNIFSILSAILKPKSVEEFKEVVRKFDAEHFHLGKSGDLTFGELRFPHVLESVFNDRMLYIKNISDKDFVLLNQIEEFQHEPMSKMFQYEFIVKPRDVLAYGLGRIEFINRKFISKKYEEFL